MYEEVIKGLLAKIDLLAASSVENAEAIERLAAACLSLQHAAMMVADDDELDDEDSDELDGVPDDVV